MWRNLCENKKLDLSSLQKLPFGMSYKVQLSSCLKIAIQFARNIRFKAYFRLSFAFVTDTKCYCCDGPNQNHIRA